MLGGCTRLAGRRPVARHHAPASAGLGEHGLGVVIHRAESTYSFQPTSASSRRWLRRPYFVPSDPPGPSRPQTITLNVYQHVLPSMARDAGEALSASLLG
jgi:hypothetical protein